MAQIHQPVGLAQTVNFSQIGVSRSSIIGQLKSKDVSHMESSTKLTEIYKFYSQAVSSSFSLKQWIGQIFEGLKLKRSRKSNCCRKLGFHRDWPPFKRASWCK